MSYREKNVLTSITAGLVILASYVFYGYSQYQLDPEIMLDMKFWAETMLKFIGVGIIVTIIVQIVFHILYSIWISISENIKSEIKGKGQVDDKKIERKIKAEFVEDERDKIIELKSLRVGFAFAGTGFVAGLFALYFDQPGGVMLNITFLSMMIGSILEGITQLFYYRRG
jgi:Na+/citrate or Na+/malate symporter